MAITNRERLINVDPEIMGGEPVFMGTRVPIRVLFEHLVAGVPLGEFLEDFESVEREQAVRVLEEAQCALLSGNEAHSAR